MAVPIDVIRNNSKTFTVTVNQATRTKHTVTLEPEYYEKLTGGKVTEETLIEKSFEFLLEHENNTSILSSFDLPVIGNYFHEYEKSIARRL